jgi:hypothetical protein
VNEKTSQEMETELTRNYIAGDWHRFGHQLAYAFEFPNGVIVANFDYDKAVKQAYQYFLSQRELTDLREKQSKWEAVERWLIENNHNSPAAIYHVTGGTFFAQAEDGIHTHESPIAEGKSIIEAVENWQAKYRRKSLPLNSV